MLLVGESINAAVKCDYAADSWCFDSKLRYLPQFNEEGSNARVTVIWNFNDTFHFNSLYLFHDLGAKPDQNIIQLESIQKTQKEKISVTCYSGFSLEIGIKHVFIHSLPQIELF